MPRLWCGNQGFIFSVAERVYTIPGTSYQQTGLLKYICSSDQFVLHLGHFPANFFFQTQIKSGKLELINWRPVFCYNQQLLDVWCAGSTSGDGFDSSTRPTRLDPRRLEMWGKDRDRFSRATPTGKNRFLTYLQCWLMDTWINLISRLTRAQICIKIYIYIDICIT